MDEREQTYGGQKSRLRQFLEMLVVLIAVGALLQVFHIRDTGNSSVFSFQEDGFTFSPCEEVTTTVTYREITALALVDTPASFGACGTGGTGKDLAYGSWQDAGEETLVYVQTMLPKAVLLETAEQRLLFNFTDERSTEALYASLREVWEDSAAEAPVQIGE